MLLAYLGSDDRRYMDYSDARTGRMLEVTPGGIYDVRVTPGRDDGLPLPPGDGRWGPASPPLTVPGVPVPAPAVMFAPSALPATPAGGPAAPSTEE